MKELNVKMSFYLEMKEGESKEDAERRFYKIMEKIEEMDVLQESSYQVYETTVEES